MLERRRRFRNVDGDGNERFRRMCRRFVLRSIRERERDVSNKPGILLRPGVVGMRLKKIPVVVNMA